jgi:pimeloyl-ACP methyl ester carboxylesterase/class 3 adenylate cyclase
MQPKTCYARSGDIHIAYQVVGDGPRDLVAVPGFVSNVEQVWEEPSIAYFYERLASFARLILLDKRGTGLSDPAATAPTLEERMDDVRAVMESAGSGRAALFGLSEGGVMAALFAATYPERTSGLVLCNSFARLVRSEDYPAGVPPERMEAVAELVETAWGEGDYLLRFAASVASEERYKRWAARWERMGASPGLASQLVRFNFEVDIRNVLPAISVPTLVLHCTGDPVITVSLGRYLAENIPDARFVELPGIDHWPWFGGSDRLIDEIEEFLTGVRHNPQPDRVLKTVLFTDIVGSTEHAAQTGDRRWRSVLASHHNVVRRELERFGGREVDTAGDGFLATFDGPARAVHCACSISKRMAELGIAIRAGLHTGEVEVIGDNVGGIAVHTGARVASKAGAGDVLVSSTVKDLVVGSGIRFDDLGRHRLKGVPETWRLYRVEAP